MYRDKTKFPENSTTIFFLDLNSKCLCLHKNLCWEEERLINQREWKQFETGKRQDLFIPHPPSPQLPPFLPPSSSLFETTSSILFIFPLLAQKTTKATMAKKNQVARNERERNRVHQVNHGFDVLRTHLQPKNQNKKWSKADTLREAVKYIQRLQHILNQEPQQQTVSSPNTSPNYVMSSNNYPAYASKEQFSMYHSNNSYNQMPTHQMSVLPHGDSFNSPTSSVSSSSYSPTQMCYPPVSYANYQHS
ncbi:hypothetical protein B9Z55_006285 [Caenorhabditis nigoni]|uniref:BHLH domain-containing protein n=1 Tax=Caenorhabditis nigoni TaxID=1611254 RepID=A0A2G5V4I1_9PELO|nr:hypothetical protein B9Z55_006285 [Caenorhabditis nigoni]